MSADRDAAVESGSVSRTEDRDGEDRDQVRRDGDDREENDRDETSRPEDRRSGALTAAFDYEAVTIEDAPARLGTVMAIGAAFVAVAASALTVASLATSALGAVLVGAGLLAGSRRVLGAGTIGLVGGIGLAGLTGAPPEPLLVASAAAAVAWDVGENAIGLGEQLGRAADTTRAELVHAAGTVTVTGLAAGIGAIAYRLSGPRPALALVTLLLGAVLLVIALGE